MSVRSMIRVCVVVVVLVALPGTGHAVTQQASPVAASVVLPPDVEVDGIDPAGWSASSWQWFFSLPAEINPFFDESGALCGYGQHGPVFFLAGAERDVERACAVPAGTHIFVPLLGSACSTVEPPPFFGEDEADLQRCATEAMNMAEGSWDMSAMRLSVDGVDAGDLSVYRAVTPLYTLWLPEDNLLGVDNRAADSVADGYQVMLAPLPVGEHVVEIVLPGPDIAVTITYVLTSHPAPTPGRRDSWWRLRPHRHPVLPRTRASPRDGGTPSMMRFRFPYIKQDPRNCYVVLNSRSRHAVHYR